MIKRILAAIGADPASRGALAWSLEMARGGGAELTVVPMVDPESWKESLPSVMAAGYAARVLERRPWEDLPIRLRDLDTWCKSICADAGVVCSMSEPERDPLEWLAGLSRCHDLLVYSGDGDALDAVTRRAAAPVLVVPRETHRIESVLVCYSGSVESARTAKQFAQMRLWPEAPLEIVCAHAGAREAETLLSGLARYCRAHGYEVRLTHIEGDAAHLPGYVERTDPGLVVAADNERGVARAARTVFMSH